MKMTGTAPHVVSDARHDIVCIVILGRWYNANITEAQQSGVTAQSDARNDAESGVSWYRN